ncbi:hypothetical protein IIM_01879 [Bacillus cereus VD107]|nr:hypothetical protein IIM_01879 [Bacillus cereus VD107]
MGKFVFLIIIIGVCIAGYFLEKFLRKKLNMSKRGFWGYKHVNSLHIKMEIGLFIVYLIASIIYMYKFENANMGYALFTYLGITWILRAWMEWKYDRESKEYILSLMGVFAFVFMISMLFYLDSLST